MNSSAFPKARRAQQQVSSHPQSPLSVTMEQLHFGFVYPFYIKRQFDKFNPTTLLLCPEQQWKYVEPTKAFSRTLPNPLQCWLAGRELHVKSRQGGVSKSTQQWIYHAWARAGCKSPTFRQKRARDIHSFPEQPCLVNAPWQVYGICPVLWILSLRI